VVAGMLKSLGVDRQSCLLAISSYDADVWRSARNIARLKVSPAGDLNAYDLLRQKRLLITRDAIDQLRKQESTR